MTKATLFSLLFIFCAFPATAEPLGFITINDSLVADKLMPVGTEVKIKVRQISRQFNTGIAVDCFPESVFDYGRPSNARIRLKSWRAIDLLEGDVLSYTTDQRCFIGFSAIPDYKELSVGPLDNDFRRLTMNHRQDYRWVIDVKFPDYAF